MQYRKFIYLNKSCINLQFIVLIFGSFNTKDKNVYNKQEKINVSLVYSIWMWKGGESIGFYL
jgi:hypothetical protein